jgi:N-carbamoylputrescine amidase
MENVMGKNTNVGLIQMSCSDNLEENFDKTVDYIEQAASQGAEIVCTQELFKSRYFCQVVDSSLFGLAEEINEQTATMQRLCTLAADLKIVIIASLFEKRASGLYHNTAVVIDADGSFLGKYRKNHIPDDPGYYEKYYFTPGDLGYPVFRTRYADVGILICWDQWFPEAARLVAMKGAEIIFIPTAIGYTPSDTSNVQGSDYNEAWLTVQQGHAVANSCYLAAVNRVGFEGTPENHFGINFWGQSFISNPYGQVLKKASMEKDEILVCPVDLSLVENLRDCLPFPFRDRRVDTYGDLTRLYSD